ncbi:MAG: tetratricopeptide repeat protein [Ahniella sp.]|nr:tetratricopeptide repeat protein [Ahniella sp.]
MHFALLTLLAVVLLPGCSGKQDFSRKETRLTPKAEIRNDPKQAAKTNTSLGQAYLSKGQIDLAMDKLLKALELDPKNADTHTVIAVAYEQIGKMNEAEKHYRQAHKLSPQAGLTANNLGRFLCAQGHYADAEKMFGLALEDPFYKTPETAILNRAVCARKDGRTEFATDSSAKFWRAGHWIR